MSAADALLFIDTNKYLDLYRLVQGKRIVIALGEQAEYIFVTQQVVDEVQRRKFDIVKSFLDEKFGPLSTIPDHLFGGDANRSSLINEQIKKVNRETDKFASELIDQVFQSQDDVSKALAPIFAKVVAHTANEFQRAKDRRERGNPPGKRSDPIGDQLTWEQILTHFGEKRKKRLWVISKDSDYGRIYGKKQYLNPFLYDELCKINPNAEAFMFTNTIDGIKDFAAKTGVKAIKLPTPEEAKEIKKEEKDLPPWSTYGIYPSMPELHNLWEPIPDTLKREVLKSLFWFHNPPPPQTETDQGPTN
jgi:hypothetical protein